MSDSKINNTSDAIIVEDLGTIDPEFAFEKHTNDLTKKEGFSDDHALKFVSNLKKKRRSKFDEESTPSTDDPKVAFVKNLKKKRK